jgi:ABC-2 type transport system permease protein
MHAQDTRDGRGRLRRHPAMTNHEEARMRDHAAETSNAGRMVPMGTRRFGRVNWLGLATLAERENRRFLAVWTQTLMAPLITAGLFMVIFSIAIGPQRGAVMGVDFTTFIAPGILMMTLIQNAFANTSSSIVIAKVQGNIVDTLMPPLSSGEMLLGYLAGGIGRGVFVALAIAVGLSIVLGIVPAHPLWALVFILLGATFMSAVGIVAGIFANKFDQMAAITNFVVTPLAFLSGTFYSVEALPPLLNTITHYNPIFYLIDGARFGVLGVSDSDPLLGLAVGLSATLAICLLAWRMLATGYRLKA